MANKKYSSPEEVAQAITVGLVKRKSMLVMKRQYKKKGDDVYSRLLECGIALYDNTLKNLCSFYKKPVDQLSVHELVQLETNNKEYFTHDHTKKYSMLMLGVKGITIEEYEGMILTPEEVRRL